MIFVDTSAFFAIMDTKDRAHTAAIEWLGVSNDTLLSTDYVIDESLTLLRSRGQAERAIELGRDVLVSQSVVVHRLTDEDFRRSWETFYRFDDKLWSFTDCSSKVVMEQLGITKAFAFDEHFAQFATVQLVP